MAKRSSSSQTQAWVCGRIAAGSAISRGLRAIFQGAVFLGAFLLFLVEPMAAKELLPVFGGSSAVWMTCLVFFQSALLAGYLYAHLLVRDGTGTRWLQAHWALLIVALVCTGMWMSGHAPGWVGAGHPTVSLCGRLAISIGLPFVVLASTSPLLQVWLRRMETGSVPYRLYGLSNVGSLLALALYPSVIEPNISLRIQRITWAAGFAAFAAISAWLAWRTATTPCPIHRAFTTRDERVAAEQSESVPTPSSAWTKLLWLLLPMVGAMQLSAVTEHMTANVAAIPLLWILPLATYLLTFVAAFQGSRWVPRTPLLGVLAVLLYALGNFLTRPEFRVPVGLSIGLFLAELLAACLVCHTELYRLRPHGIAQSTHFYLTMAAGGAAGSFLIAVVAPMVFAGNYDLSLTFAATAAVVLAVCWQDGWKQRLLWGAATVALAWFCVTLNLRYSQSVLASQRNFYGGLRVKSDASIDGDSMRTLMHGSIVHGTQIFSDKLMQVPTTYYAPDSGIGLALASCCGERARRIGVVGLGVGTVAAYGRQGDSIRFYEINPAVRPIAENWFTYLRQSKAKLTFAEGDARTSLSQEQSQGFDVLAIDAFSGDAIPLHLLTVEAMAIYRRHLAPGGVLAFHISNQYVDLEPELAALANATGMQAKRVTSAAVEPRGEFQASWILLTDSPDFFAQQELATAVQLKELKGVKAWTDDASSLLRLVRW
jgi:spermidine synthase